MRIKNKVALVTGGGSGIGEAICERFAEEGATVIVSDINLDSAKSLANKITSKGFNAKAILQDVTIESRWIEVVSEIIEQYGQLDVLVNNAGIGILEPFEDVSLENWHKTLEVNMDSVFLGTREAIKVMKSNKQASIINISSVAAMIGISINAAYTASKGGVRTFTKSAALHCAESNYNIRVNSLHPGYIETPMVRKGVASQKFMPPEELKAVMLATIPTGVMGKPIDVANAALYLASDESAYMTGSELVIDGGFTAR